MKRCGTIHSSTAPARSGPMAFQHILYGQGTIHPANTGEWMRYVYDQAWAAQTNTAAYPTLAERRQILAFAYGYLTHAAGDMWAQYSGQ